MTKSIFGPADPRSKFLSLFSDHHLKRQLKLAEMGRDPTKAERAAMEVLRPHSSAQIITPLSSRLFKNRQGERSTVIFARITHPNHSIRKQLEVIHRRAWSEGVDTENQEIIALQQQVLYATDRQIKKMTFFSDENIVVAYIPNKDGSPARVLAAIFGNQLDVLGDPADCPGIKDYNTTTAHLTFENSVITGNSKLCVSVIVDPQYQGISTDDKDKKSLGRMLIHYSLLTTLAHPFQTRLFAYSRPSSLSRFASYIWDLTKNHGYTINFDEEHEVWIAEKAGIKYIMSLAFKTNIDSSIKKDKPIQGFGFFAYSEEYNRFKEDEPPLIFDHFIPLANLNKDAIRQTMNGLVFLDGTAVGLDKKGVYIEDSQKHITYLFPIKGYLEDTGYYLLITSYKDHNIVNHYVNETPFDQMVAFHTGEKGKLKHLIVHSRYHEQYPEIVDKASLGSNIPFEYFIFTILNPGLFKEELWPILNYSQKIFLREAINSPDYVEGQIKQPNYPYANAFSRAKASCYLDFIRKNHKELQKLLHQLSS